MTRYFYDCEFHEDGTIIDLISIGIVADDGREYQAVNRDADWGRIKRHPWLMANVVPYLPPVAQGYAFDGRVTGRTPTDFYGHSLVKSASEIAEGVEAFIGATGADRADHELWGYYPAYDHVVLCQLWGTMMALPGCVPMRTRDIMDLADTPELRGVDLSSVVPQQNEHHALADARWNRDVYNWIKTATEES